MYWCRSKIIYRAVLIVSILFAGAFSACKPEIKETGDTLKYVDLKAYFKGNSAHLTVLNKPVYKTVTHNGVTESKKVHIDNWERELSLFSESDINKPAWKDSYFIQNTVNTLVYKAKYPELQTREIIINRENDKIKRITIVNHTQNILYETREKLIYIPDSMYNIEKMQHVKLLGSNKYDITGILNQ
ncbi:MAG: hypothetical protein JWQ06_59 [Mucilaginibacter sp.]|nr:hypothetical protein [Mucilaginibacter sp.]